MLEIVEQNDRAPVREHVDQRLLEALAGLLVPYPSFAEVGKRAATTYYTGGLTSPLVRRIIGWLRRFG